MNPPKGQSVGTPADLSKTLQQVGDDWDSMQNDPGFSKLSSDQQSEFRHWYFTEKIIKNPTIASGVRNAPELGSMLHHGFFDEETKHFDEQADKYNTSIWNQPLTRGLGLDADNVDVREHPVYHGIAKLGEGLTTPKQLGILGATMAAGPIAGAALEGVGVGAGAVATATKTLSGIMDAGFSLDMLHGAYQQVPQIAKLYDAAQAAERAGNEEARSYYHGQLISSLTQLAGGLGFAALSAHGALKNTMGAMGGWAEQRVAAGKDVQVTPEAPKGIPSIKVTPPEVSPIPKGAEALGTLKAPRAEVNTQAATDQHMSAYEQAKAKLGPEASMSDVLQEAARIQNPQNSPLSKAVTEPQRTAAPIEGTITPHEGVTPPDRPEGVVNQVPTTVETLRAKMKQSTGEGVSDVTVQKKPIEGSVLTPREKFDQARAEAIDRAGKTPTPEPKAHAELGNKTFNQYLSQFYTREGDETTNPVAKLEAVAEDLKQKGFVYDRAKRDRYGSGATATFEHPNGATLHLGISSDGTINGGVFSGGEGKVGPKTIEGEVLPPADPTPKGLKAAEAMKTVSKKMISDQSVQGDTSKPVVESDGVVAESYTRFGKTMWMAHDSKGGSLTTGHASEAEALAAARASKPDVPSTPPPVTPTPTPVPAEVRAKEATPPSAPPASFKLDDIVRVRTVMGEQTGRVEMIAPKGVRIRTSPSSTLMIKHEDVLGPVDAPAPEKLATASVKDTLARMGATSEQIEAVAKDSLPVEKPSAPKPTPDNLVLRERLIKEGFAPKDIDRILHQQAVALTKEARVSSPEANKVGEQSEAPASSTARSPLSGTKTDDTSSASGRPVEGTPAAEVKVPREWAKNPTVYTTLKDHVEEKLHFTTPEIRGMALDAALGAYRRAIEDPSTRPGFALKQAKDVISSLADQGGFLSFKPKKGAPVNSPIDTFAAWLDAKINPSPEAQLTMNELRQRGGILARNRSMLWKRVGDWIQSHGTDTPGDLRRIADYAEGREPLGPADQSRVSTSGAVSATEAEAVRIFKEQFAIRWPRLSEIMNKDPESGIEGYLARLFKDKHYDVAMSIEFGRRDLQGPKTFTKERVNTWFTDGLDQGMEPVSNNYFEMQMLGLHQVDKFISAHDVKDALKERGVVRFFKLADAGTRPVGWTKLDDRIFQPRYMGEGGLITPGAYYAPKDVARVFNNYLAPGLSGDWRYNLVRKVGNFENQWQLAFSGYHGTFSTLVSSMNDVSLGLMRTFNQGDFGHGARDISRGLIPGYSALQNFKLGRRLFQEYVEPGTHPEMSEMVELFQRGGGRMGMDPVYSNRAVEEFKQIWGNNRFSVQMPFKGMSALAEYTSRWLMKYYVPNLKAGAFAKMASFKLDSLMKSGTDIDTINTEMGKIADSMDNRHGQMIYDNLFWNKTIKDLSFFGMRSAGWNIGSGREFGGAIADAGKMLYKASRGERPQILPRLAFSMALPMVVASYGAFYGYLTGHPPQEATDYFFPRTGGFGVDGKPERVSLPSYLKDVIAFSQHPAQTALHKLHPVLQNLSDIYQNKDFYDTEIRHTGDAPWRQALQIGAYVGKQMIPFGLSQSHERANAGESKAQAYIGGELGIAPAPRYLGETKAEELAYELSTRHIASGPRTQREFDSYQTLRKLRSQFDAGRVSEDQLADALDKGKLTPNQFNDILGDKDNGISSLQRHTKNLVQHPEEFLRVYQLATPEEKIQLLDGLGSAWNNVDPDRDPDLFKHYEEAFPK